MLLPMPGGLLSSPTCWLDKISNSRVVGVPPVPWTITFEALPPPTAVTLLTSRLLGWTVFFFNPSLIASICAVVGASNVSFDLPVFAAVGTFGWLSEPTTYELALNPLSPCPGIAWPLRGSWFLFTFSSLTSAFGLASGVSLDSALAFGIVSNTKALFFRVTVALSTSPCVAVSLASRACALANSAFPSSIAEAVFSVTAAFAIAFWTRAIAALRLALFAFATVGAGVSSLAGVVAAVSLAGSLALFTAVSLLAKALPPPKNAKPAATNTDAVPTLNFLIPYWLTFSSCFCSFIFLLFLLYIINLLLYLKFIYRFNLQNLYNFVFSKII